MLTYEGANKLLDCLTGRSQSYAYTAVYVGLGLKTYDGQTVAPERTGTFLHEPEGNGYARVLLGTAQQAATQKMSAAALGASANTDIIYFPEATGAWGTCKYFALYSAAEGGTCIAYGELTSEISPIAETVPIIRVNDLKMLIS